ncbi:hypothetical protein FOZ61_000636 [Perkinsus olseni]|uniref:ArsA/GET3 Anion-transporting ATPase-like domain-containing protein n=1 Tax=Perkinsus olseni TaxID=32597 RepID=A0A7J6LZC6_PEROL|nr:hypothetical protein FOZ61_000636 [Perkinsus olseni]
MTAVIGRYFCHRSVRGPLFPPASSRCFCSTERKPEIYLDRLLEKGAPKYLFVGGKGGVGKTTWAAALAVRFGRSGLRTLCVSTDPAHSLADALQVELKGEPTLVEESLYGLEVDAEAAMNEFAAAVSLDNVQKATGVDLRSGWFRDRIVGPTGLGHGKLPWCYSSLSKVSVASKVGVDIAPIEAELSGFLGGVGKASTAPPGMDEIVAMARLMQLLHSSRYAEFDRIVIDTAPTGHTLRLLSLPTFIHTALTATTQIYDKVSAALKAFTPLQTVYSSYRSFMPDIPPHSRAQILFLARERVEQFQEGISNLNGVLQNSEESGFVVVSIPTQLAVDESLRLIEALPLAGMKIEQVVINQMPPVLVAADADVKDLVESYRGASSKLNELSKKGELQELTKEEVKLARDALDAQRTLVYESAKQAARLVEGLDRGIGVTRLPVIKHNVLGAQALDNAASHLFSHHSARKRHD